MFQGWDVLKLGGDSELQQMRQSQDFKFPEIGISVVHIPFFRIKKKC